MTKRGTKLRTKRRKGQASLPRAIAKRIMRRAARGERAAVVVNKSGKPSRVYNFDQYLKRRERTKQVKPWEHRKNRRPPDPLGAVEGTVLTPITREYMYE